MDAWNALKNIGDCQMLQREFGTRINGLLHQPERRVRFSLV